MKHLNLKTIVTSLLFIWLFSFGGKAQLDSVSYYVNGYDRWVYQQPDILSFRLTDRSQYTGTFNPNIVEGIEYFGTSDGINNIYFTPTATLQDKSAVYSAVSSATNFEKFFVVGTKAENVGEPHHKGHWMGTDMFINVVFEEDNVTLATAQAFASTYELRIAFAPASWITKGVYVFEVPKDHSILDYYSPSLTTELTKYIWEHDSLIIDKIAPSLRIFRPHAPNDPLYNDQWWTRDNVPFNCYGQATSLNANIDLDCAQNFNQEIHEGPSYLGSGISIGVIDYDGIQFSHPDANFGDGWICLGQGPNPLTILLNYDIAPIGPQNSRAHGQAVCGIIGAQIDNNEGIVGVAPNSVVKPCIHFGSTGQLNSLLMSLLNDDVDVINMSLGFGDMTISEAQELPFYQALEDCRDLGRGGKGIVLVASTGNDNSQASGIPAALPMVLSVGATNPLDQRKTAGDGFSDPNGLDWGGNYFEYLGVSAPGSCVESFDFDDTTFINNGTIGYGTGIYTSFGGTSAATAIVSGIAALVLEKEPTLTYNQVYDAIKFSCDKVGNYTYSNNSPNGKCLELGFGRVNACSALNIIDQLNIEEQEEASMKIIHNNPVQEFLGVSFEETMNFEASLLSATGQVVFSSSYNNQNYFEIDMKEYSRGIYFLNIKDLNSTKSYSSKIIHQ